VIIIQVDELRDLPRFRGAKEGEMLSLEVKTKLSREEERPGSNGSSAREGRVSASMRKRKAVCLLRAGVAM